MDHYDFGGRVGAPAVQRRALGNQLRQLREARGITAGQASEAIRGRIPRSAG